MFNDKIFYSVPPTLEQEIMIISFLEEKKYYSLLENNHMYVFLSNKPEEVFFKLYKSSRVKHMCLEYNFTEQEVIDYFFHSFNFYQELREVLYWNNIGNYKKYVPCTGEIKTTAGVEQVVENECVFAKTEKEAELLFKDIGFNDLMYVVDLDE
jgi:hypothetical protein